MSRTRISFRVALRAALCVGAITAVFTLSAAEAQSFHDPASASWRFLYNVTDARYHSAWESYGDDGYLPIDIEMDKGGKSYSGVWQENTDNRRWVSWRRLTSSDFHDKWEEYRKKGYRPIDQDAEVIGGKLRYSLVMVENKEGLAWKSNRNLSSETFSEKFAANKDKYMPIDVDAVEHKGSMLYSIIWVENKANRDWVELRNMTPTSYGEKFEKYRREGYRVADLDCYKRRGKLNYAAIWEKNDPGRGWAALRQMSGTQMRNAWHKYSDQGMRIIDIEMCPTDGKKMQFAAVWRENGDRYDWPGRGDAEQALEDYVANANVPGVGAAIIRNGTVIFRGGSGFADSEKNIAAHSGTIYRLASISKAVTGTLGYDMEEAGLINLDTRTDSFVTDLASNHDHSVRQLLQTRGCVKHYTNDGNNDNGTQTSFATAQAALDDHMGGAMKTNSWIRSGCTPPSWTYSTHSYTLAAAALEVAGEASFSSLVKTRISDPLGLDTLRVEFRSSPDSSGERAKIYAGGSGVSNSSFQNTTWKAGGGGMESSALHLARFGDGVLRNRYFPQTTRDVLWSGGGQNARANGWTFNAGANQVTKGGDQQGSDSHIRIDIGNGITVVALTNTNPPAVETSTLTQQLLTIALANP